MHASSSSLPSFPSSSFGFWFRRPSARPTLFARRPTPSAAWVSGKEVEESPAMLLHLCQCSVTMNHGFVLLLFLPYKKMGPCEATWANKQV